MQKIPYQIEERNSKIALLVAEGKTIVDDVTTDIVDGRLTNCYFMVVDAPPTAPDLLADADE